MQKLPYLIHPYLVFYENVKLPSASEATSLWWHYGTIQTYIIITITKKTSTESVLASSKYSLIVHYYKLQPGMLSRCTTMASTKQNTCKLPNTATLQKDIYDISTVIHSAF